MKLIFHIGMGKTGTSSIQRCLKQAGDSLHAQKAHYLGMWFNPVFGPDYRGFEGLARIAHSDAAQKAELAGKFADYCRMIEHQTGADILIMSNEGIFEYAQNFADFFSVLAKRLDLTLMCYVRPPQDWLSSAFTQWNIYHKVQSGPVQSFGQRAPALLQTYRMLRVWHDTFPDIFEARLYDKSGDVVQDFGHATGLALTSPPERMLMRPKPEEIVLRAIFNNRFEEPVLPDAFDEAVQTSMSRTARPVDDMIGLCFEMEGLGTLLESQRDLLDFMRDTLGLDVPAPSETEAKPVDYDSVRRKLFDALIEIALGQAQRITKLEQEIREIKKAAGPRG